MVDLNTLDGIDEAIIGAKDDAKRTAKKTAKKGKEKEGSIAKPDKTISKLMEESQALSFGLQRVASHAAFDYHLWELLGVDSIFARMTDEELNTASAQVQGEKLAGVRRGLKARIREQGSTRKVEQVQSIIKYAADGGISLTYSELNRQDDHFPPNDRAGGLYYCLAKSPGLATALDAFLKIRSTPGQEKEQVLIVANDPVMQQ